MLPEFDAHASRWEIASAVEHRGAALVRQAVPETTAAMYRRNLERVVRNFEANQLPDLRSDERAALARGDVWPELFRTYGGLCQARFFSTPLVSGIVKALLVKPRPYNSTILTVSPDNTTGIAMHTDGIIQGTREAVVALWSPLNACGTVAPGLGVIPAPRDAVLGYLRHCFPDKDIPPWCSTTEWASAFEAGKLRAAFGEPVSPVMRPGDVVVFTNWTLHGSDRRPGMTGSRAAIVQRWTGEAWREGRPLHRFIGSIRKALSAPVR